MSIAIAHLTIHEWDKDGQKVKLPKKMKVEIEIDEGETMTIGQIHEDAMDKASDETGWCILGCTLERIDFK